mgnify:CR=1 FL=1
MSFDWGQNTLPEPYYDALMGNPATDPNAPQEGQTEMRPVVASDGTFMGYSKHVYSSLLGQWIQIGNIMDAPKGPGGSGGGPSIVGGTITGAAAPDPIGAALALAQKMAAEATAEQGWADAAYDRWIAELKRIEIGQKRNVDEANRALGVQEEVGRRAGTIARDILPGMINAEQLNIPELNAIMGGPYKGLKLDIPAMFTQGTPGLAASQPLPAPDFGGLAPLPILEKPQGIDLVAFAELLAKGAAGFPGFPQMPPFATV